MPNPSGANDFGGHALRYGEELKLGELERVGPIPGNTATAAAKNTPRRSQRRAQRGQAEPTPEQLAQASVTPPAQPSYDAQVASVWEQIAATPGARNFPVIGEMAQAAAQKAGK